MSSEKNNYQQLLEQLLVVVLFAGHYDSFLRS